MSGFIIVDKEGICFQVLLSHYNILYIDYWVIDMLKYDEDYTNYYEGISMDIPILS